MKYKELFNVNDNFQYSINLQFDIGNIEKISQYIPTTDSCEIMEYYFDSIMGKYSKSTTLVGPYGKGKSHLILVLSTLLSDYKDEDAYYINELLEKIKKVNLELYNKVTDVRKKKLKYLPVIINSNYNNIPQAFLLAMTEALEREQIIELNVETYFSTALNVINKWKENDDVEVINKFEKCLKSNNISLDKLVMKLRTFEDEGYNIFKEVYKCVMHGIEFNPLINTDIVKYYKDVNYKLCQNGYNGLFIIFDEFSKFLEYIGNENMSKELKIIQDFGELANRSGKNEQILFSCITHKAINEYAKNIKEEKANAFKTVEGRFKEIYFNRSIEQNYEIIAETIKCHGDATQIKLENRSKNKKFYDDLKGNYRFCQGADSKIKLFDDCYPLNPLTVYSVVFLSEKIAQNERTLFTFLTDDDINSFKTFLNSADVGELFNLDKVYDYFYNIFRKEKNNDIKEIWVKSENAINKTQDLIERKIIKAMAILYMLNDFDTLAPVEITIKNALGFANDELDNVVINLIDKGVIKRKKSNKLLDFTTIYNKELLNEVQKTAEVKFKNINIEEALSRIIDFGYVIPRRYNQNYKMTRFFKEAFVTDVDLLKFKSLDSIKNKYFSDGLILNVIKTKESTDELRVKCSELSDEHVIIKIPSNVVSDELLNALREYEAAEYIKRTQTNDDDEIRELNLLLEDNKELIEKEIIEKFSNKNTEFVLYLDKEVKTDNWGTLTSEICEKLYNRTPVINNEMINKEQVSQPIKKATGIVVACVLNQDTEIIKSATSAEATIYKSIVEKRENNDIRMVVDLIKNTIRKNGENEKISFSKIYNQLIKKPYGIRKGILPVLIAMALQEYDGNIILYYQNKEVDVDYINIEKTLDEPEKYYILIEKGTKAKKDFINKMLKLFDVTVNNNEVDRSRIKLLVAKMKKWALGLPRIARELDATNEIVDNMGYLHIKNRLIREGLNNNEFLFIKLKQYLNLDNFEDIYKEISTMKNKFDNYVDAYSACLALDIKEFFAHKTKSTLNKVLVEWYGNIDDSIKQMVINSKTKRLFDVIKELKTYNETEIIQMLSSVLVGVYIEDWQKQTKDEFFEQLNNLLNDIRNVDIRDTDKKTVEISVDGKEIKKMINNETISILGDTLKNNIEDVLDEYGDSISESEKITILLDIIRKYM